MAKVKRNPKISIADEAAYAAETERMFREFKKRVRSEGILLEYKKHDHFMNNKEKKLYKKQVQIQMRNVKMRTLKSWDDYVPAKSKEVK